MKVCRDCKKELPLDLFARRSSAIDGKHSVCKACAVLRNKVYYLKHKDRLKKYTSEYRKANPEKVRIVQAEYHKNNLEKIRAYRRRKWVHFRSNELLKRYGITESRKQEMVEAQKGLCAVCDSAFSGSADTHVDHDHNTRKVRDILCGRCNRALGLVKEDTRTLERLIVYIKKGRG